VVTKKVIRGMEVRTVCHKLCFDPGILVIVQRTTKRVPLAGTVKCPYFISFNPLSNLQAMKARRGPLRATPVASRATAVVKVL
jgi:hypothetical protein